MKAKKFALISREHSIYIALLQDVSRGQLVSDEIFQNFCTCLKALVKPVSYTFTVTLKDLNFG